MVEVWREGGRRKEGRKEGRTALIKSNNLHLAGDGECFNAMVGITRSKVILFFGVLELILFQGLRLVPLWMLEALEIWSLGFLEFRGPRV